MRADPSDEIVIIKTQPGWFGFGLNMSLWNEDDSFTPITKEQFVEYYNQSLAKDQKEV